MPQGSSLHQGCQPAPVHDACVSFVSVSTAGGHRLPTATLAASHYGFLCLLLQALMAHLNLECEIFRSGKTALLRWHSSLLFLQTNLDNADNVLTVPDGN